MSAKPKGRMHACNYFTQAYRAEMKAKGTPVPMGEASKTCSEKWKQMSDKAKQRFVDMAERDKARYEKEMEDYAPPEDDGKGKKRKRNKDKDPNAPKRPMTAYFLFLNDRREAIKSSNPNIKVTEVTKEAAHQWNNAEPNVRKKYDDMAAKLKANYAKELAKYNGGEGNDNGKRQKAEPKGKSKVKAPATPSSPEEESESDSDE
jgi:hypothetical protein